MEYIELKCPVSGQEETHEILMAYLSELGYESFVQEENTLKAYISADEFSKDKLDEIALIKKESINYSYELLPEKNWNAEWESQFKAAVIGNLCAVKAPFHKDIPGVQQQIIIEPKMSFGTAHHETTRLMIEFLFKYPPLSAQTLDMGCGTGVLAILAKRLGAAEITAIDNDEWAYKNTLENIQKNNAADINVYHGDAGLLRDDHYDYIMANINRNILLKDMASYASALKADGSLILSGFYKEDVAIIEDEAGKHGLKITDSKEENKWTALVLSRQED